MVHLTRPRMARPWRITSTFGARELAGTRATLSEQNTGSEETSSSGSRLSGERQHGDITRIVFGCPLNPRRLLNPRQLRDGLRWIDTVVDLLHQLLAIRERGRGARARPPEGSPRSAPRWGSTFLVPEWHAAFPRAPRSQAEGRHPGRSSWSRWRRRI